MKITEISAKNIIDMSPSLVRRAGVFAKGPVAMRLRNMRPARSLEGEVPDYVPVGVARVNTGAACWTPVGEAPRTEGGNALLLKNDSLLAAVADAMDNPALVATDAGSPVLCALLGADGRTVVMTEAGARRLTAGAEGEAPVLTDAATDYPGVVLRAVSGAPVQATVGARKLSRAYTTGHGVTDADNRALVGDYVNAYRTMVADAAAAGCYVQPVLARYRLLDSAGQVLFESAPTLLQHPDGTEFTGSQPLYSADGQTIEAYTLTARSWALMVETAPCADAAATAVAAVEVLATPQFHPYNPRMSSTVTTGRLTGSATPWGHVSLPGRSEGLTTAFGDATRRRVMRAIARMEAMEQRMAYVPTPFRAAGMAEQPVCSAEADLAEDAARLYAGMHTAVRTAAYDRVLLSPPHSFSASRCCAGAGTVAWAGLRVHRYPGYRPLSMAATTRAAEGNCLVSVRFKGMRGMMRQEHFEVLAPDHFGPVLCYPAPDATEMTISITVDGVTRRRIFALTPDESGRLSVYVEPTLGHIVLPVVSVGGILNLREPVEEYPGAVAIAEAAQPLTIKAHTIVTGGRVEALLPRNPGEASWEFGRERFLAACADRVVSVGVDTSSWRLSLRVLMPTGVAGSDAAVAVGSDICLLSAGRLVRISPRGSVATVDSGLDASRLVYDAAHDELLAIGSDPDARAYCSGLQGYYLRSLPTVDATVQIADRPYGVSSAGLVMLDRESTALHTEVGLVCASAEAGRRPRRPGWLRFAGASGDIEGSITLISANADGSPRSRLCTFGLDGPLIAPLSLALAVAPVRLLRLEFEARVTADFRLSNIQVITY